MYTDYNEFEGIDPGEEYLGEEYYSYGEEKEENQLISDRISMNLQGDKLILLDIEHEYGILLIILLSSKVLASYAQLDRLRTYLPIFIVRNKEEDKKFKKAEKKKKKKEKTVELVNESESQCIGPPILEPIDD